MGELPVVRVARSVEEHLPIDDVSVFLADESRNLPYHLGYIVRDTLKAGHRKYPELIHVLDERLGVSFRILLGVKPLRPRSRRYSVIDVGDVHKKIDFIPD